MKTIAKLISIMALATFSLGSASLPVAAAIDAPRGVSFGRVDGSHQLKLLWVNPTQTSLSRVDIYISYYEAQLYGAHPVTDPAQLVPGQKGEYIYDGLVEYQDYYFYLKAVDANGAESARTDIFKRNTALFTEVTTPGSISNLTASPAQANINLGWTNPADTDFYRANVYRSTTADFTPAVNNLVGQVAGLPSVSAGFSDTNLIANTGYFYKIVSEDVIGNTSTPVSISATTLPVPVVVPDDDTVDEPTVPPSTDTPPATMPDPTKFDYQAAWISQSGTINTAKTAHVVTGHPGDTVTLSLTLKNTGRAWWYVDTPNGAHRIKLGTWQVADRTSALQHTSWPSNNRAVGLSTVVPTGSTHTFSFTLKIPSAATVGTTYREAFRPVAEYVEWFGPTGIFWDIQVI